MGASQGLVDGRFEGVVLDVCLAADRLRRISLTCTENIAGILLKSVISYH